MLVRVEANPVHGSDRRPVGRVGAAFPAEAAARWSGKTLVRFSCGIERCAVGSAHRGSLARSATSVSSLSNLPPTFPAVAARRHAHAVAAGACRRPAGPREARFIRDVHRRQLLECEKRGAAVGPTRRGKGTKIMALVDRHGLPLACSIASASPHETQLVEPTLYHRFLSEIPERMIGDCAYDSDGLDQRLRQRYRVELIAPHNPTRTRPPTQDGRALRRYRNRWKVERFFAWLHNYRRLVTRWEFHAENFFGMLQLGCASILLRHL